MHYYLPEPTDKRHIFSLAECVRKHSEVIASDRARAARSTVSESVVEML